MSAVGSWKGCLPENRPRQATVLFQNTDQVSQTEGKGADCLKKAYRLQKQTYDEEDVFGLHWVNRWIPHLAASKMKFLGTQTLGEDGCLADPESIPIR